MNQLHWKCRFCEYVVRDARIEYVALNKLRQHFKETHRKIYKEIRRFVNAQQQEEPQP